MSRILLGVSGGIAAYKGLELIRLATGAGHSVRVVRTSVEVSVLALGWLLGGNVGLGTVVYALGIGPLVHYTIPWFARKGEAVG